MFHFIFSYKVIILLVWFLYEIKSHCMKGKNKYKFEIGTSSLTDFGGGSCAFGISLTSGSGKKPKAWMVLYILFIKILWKQINFLCALFIIVSPAIKRNRMQTDEYIEGGLLSE